MALPVMPPLPPPLIDHEFETLRPSNPIYCHQDFLEKLESYRNLPIARRTSLLMQRLAVDGRRQHYKSTHGVNQGWRRSRLGGSSGSHFYAWWAPNSAAPLRHEPGFQDAAADGAIFLRDIRHHDDHSPVPVNQLHSHYLPVSVREMRAEDYAPAPWTVQQSRFASARSPVRILKGHPGSGKTTALLHAADASGAARVLYLTYSRDLAVLARDYFDRYCSGARRFHVLTFDTFLRQLTGADPPPADLAGLRRRFRGDLTPFARQLGPWTDRVPALYDELHAHWAGAAIPAAAGRFTASHQPAVSADDYRARRLKHLGQAAVAAAVDVALRLERSGGPIARRYFPELALAWQAAVHLTGSTPAAPEFLDFDCIAVDECQDLTPLEAFVTVELAAAIGRKKRVAIPVFWAGDEAQTVRPTDFEWAWMNDILHARLGTPTEFKLSSNLRSPRSIAAVVNQVWTLYGEVDKRDRPGGAGSAEIEDDATDQVLYCTASAGPDLDRLLAELAQREGVAIVSYDESILPALPEAVRRSVLTAAEVKGLDFHTVCLINAGQHLERIVRWRDEFRLQAADIESIRRRLAIDELRVGISRPAERLIWLDIAPPGRAVEETIYFLGRGLTQTIAPSIPSALLAALGEEQLDLEERIQRCQSDARQFLAVRPDMAWSRAQQAVALLGSPGNPAAIEDESVRNAARDTLAEICFCLGFRRVQLAPELGRPDLFAEAVRAVSRPGLRTIISQIGAVVRADKSVRATELGVLANIFVKDQKDVEPWLFTEIASKTNAWLEELEGAIAVGDNAVALAHLMPPFYDALRLPDADTRKERLLDRSVRHLLKNKRHDLAIGILRMLPERRPAIEAECLEATGRYAEAAALYQSIGKLKEALTCYRAAPDFEAAAALIRQVPDHPAAEAYDWLIRMKSLIDERPASFARVLTAPEKKVLEKMLEQGLGVARKAPVKKVAAKKPAVKTAPKTPRKVWRKSSPSPPGSR